jgi:hypothetical protein
MVIANLAEIAVSHVSRRATHLFDQRRDLVHGEDIVSIMTLFKYTTHRCRAAREAAVLSQYVAPAVGSAGAAERSPAAGRASIRHGRFRCLRQSRAALGFFAASGGGWTGSICRRGWHCWQWFGGAMETM